MPMEKNSATPSHHPPLPLVRERLRNPKPENMSPDIGKSSASKGPRFGECRAMNGSPAEVAMLNETVFALVPKVTLAGVKEDVLFSGMPTTVNAMEADKLLFCGVAVIL